jgi:hypothetical protein
VENTKNDDVGCWIDWSFHTGSIVGRSVGSSVGSSVGIDSDTTCCIVLSDTTLLSYQDVITAEQMIARCLMEIFVRQVGSFGGGSGGGSGSGSGSGSGDMSDSAATSSDALLRVMSRLPTMASILSSSSSLSPSAIMSIHGLPMTFDEEARRGVPGKLLLPHDAASVQFSPLHPYSEDEIIATIDSKKLLGGGGESDLDYASIDPSTLVYGVVLRSSSSVDHGLRRLQVRSGDGLHCISLLSTKVFSFSPTTPDRNKDASSSVKQLTRAAPLPSVLPSGETKRSTAATTTTTTTTVATTTNRATDAGSDRAINSDELMDAVDAILGSVGMPLSRDQKKLMAETMELRKETRGQKKEIRKLSSENEAYKDRLLCKICMSSDVDRMLMPSGKMICRGCVNKIHGVCPFTRKKVDSVIKLYF